MIYPYMVNYGLMSFYMFQTNLSMGDRTELARQVEIRPCGSQAWAARRYQGQLWTFASYMISIIYCIIIYYKTHLSMIDKISNIYDIVPYDIWLYYVQIVYLYL